MSIYKQVSRIKDFRFITKRGPLVIDQLWDLKLSEIGNALKAVNTILKKNNDDDLSFLDETVVVDVENQLRYEILKDIYLTKKKEQEEHRIQIDRDRFNAEIDADIIERRKEDRKGLSVEELEKLRIQ